MPLGGVGMVSISAGKPGGGPGVADTPTMEVLAVVIVEDAIAA